MEWANSLCTTLESQQGLAKAVGLEPDLAGDVVELVLVTDPGGRPLGVYERTPHRDGDRDG